MRLMNTLRTLRGKRNPTPDDAAGLLAGDVVFDSSALTRGVLGWDTLGGPDPGTFDTLGGPDCRTGEDHPAGTWWPAGTATSWRPPSTPASWPGTSRTPRDHLPQPARGPRRARPRHRRRLHMNLPS